jgi:nucleotide-binding universal stress UspA family protein
MMRGNSGSLDIQSVQDFRAARLRASVEMMRAVLVGKSADLLSYEDVREKLQAKETNQRKLKNIPLDTIVGSMGRYSDFTRSFFPRQEKDEDRWARVRMQVEGSEGLPPIEAYQLGDVYFVIDGNHRVSVARSLGATHIEGYVTQVHASVPLSAKADADELIIAERYAHFLENTRLNQSFPEIDLSMSVAGNYRVLDERIRVHQEWMGAGVSYQDAAVSWYKKVYKPVVKIIRQRGMLRDFPDRTETDLYAWIMQYRQELAEEMGWALDHEMAAVDLVNTFSKKPARVFKRLFQRMYDTLTFDAFEAGPMTGEWRRMLLETRAGDRMFKRVLAALNGRDDGWDILDHAAQIAQRERGRVFGLHVCKGESAKESATVGVIQSAFELRCKQADGCAGLRIETGNISRAICDSARWMDLVVLNLTHPPGAKPLDRISSGFSQLLRRCPCPVLAISQEAGKITRALLAYDDSPASREALFVAAYLVRQWELPLTVIAVNEKERKKDLLASARQYLDQQGIAANYIEKQGNAAMEISKTAKASRSNLIIMGNYGAAPFFSIALGSTVDDVLRAFDGSVLVCR